MIQKSASPLPGEPAQPLAEQLFLNGDFAGARLEYQRIYATALSAEDRNHALYGLACTQMMAADTEEQFIEGIGNLQKWHAGKGTAPFSENRLLLVLALNQQSKRITEQDKERIARETAQTALIDDQKKKISEMTSTVQKLQSKIEELHNQIAALEAIDMNVQEKQNSL
ncbi:hypothetical protein [Desulfocastanea catecholica]